MAETTRSDSDAARTIFYVAAILMAIFGAGLLLFPQVMFTLSDDPGVPANPGWVRWAGGLLLGMAVAMASCQQSREPKASGDGIGHGLYPDRSGLALQQPRRRLPWNAIVELAADLGQRSPCGCDVVAIV